jgi:hypothetical protein
MKSISGTIGNYVAMIYESLILMNTAEKIPGLGPLVEKIQDSISGQFYIDSWMTWLYWSLLDVVFVFTTLEVRNLAKIHSSMSDYWFLFEKKTAFLETSPGERDVFTSNGLIRGNQSTWSIWGQYLLHTYYFHAILVRGCCCAFCLSTRSLPCSRP